MIISEPKIESTSGDELEEITNLRPDAFMEGLQQRHFDQNGQVKTTLVATSLLDFGDRADTKLLNPRLWLKRPTGTWHLEADFGVLTADRNRVNLRRDVFINRLESGEVAFRLDGDVLNWDLETDLITSETTTKMVQGSAISIGDQLILDLNTNKYSLGDKVRMQWRSATSSD